MCGSCSFCGVGQGRACFLCLGIFGALGVCCSEIPLTGSGLGDNVVASHDLSNACVVIYVLGPTKVGKSTLCKSLTERRQRCFHLDLDKQPFPAGDWAACRSTFQLVEDLPQGRNTYLIDIGAGTQHQCREDLTTFLCQNQRAAICVSADPSLIKPYDPLGNRRSMEEFTRTEFNTRQALFGLARGQFKRGENLDALTPEIGIFLDRYQREVAPRPKERQFHLVGIDHSRQKTEGEGAEALAVKLRELCLESDAEALIEEFSDHSLTVAGIPRTPVQQVASELSLDHFFLEPKREAISLFFPSVDGALDVSYRGFARDDGEFERLVNEEENRRDLGGERDQFSIRESCWLAVAEDQNIQSAIAIVGSRHLETLPKLAREEGYRCDVVARLD
jgi:hypothetical protein